MSTVTDDDIAALYGWALNYARKRVTHPDERREGACDAATDAVVWVLKHRDRVTGDFRRYARQAVRRAVYRYVGKAVWQTRHRPQQVGLHAGLEARPDRNGEAPSADIDSLPAELRDAVRLYVIDGYTLRETALLLNCGHDTVRQRLRAAAVMLNPDQGVPARPAGARRHRAG